MMSALNVIEVLPGEDGVLAAAKAMHQLFEAEESCALVRAGDATARSALELERPLWTAEPCAVLVTSGSTVRPRAVELPLSALAAAAEQSAIFFRNRSWRIFLPNS